MKLNMKLWHKVTFALIAGVIFGLIAKEKVIYVKPIGDIFIGLIKMVVVPLIYCSLVTGITSMNNKNSIGRIGIKSTIAFLTTTIFAISIGLIIGEVMKPGVGVTLSFNNDLALNMKTEFDFLKFLINIVPHNAIGALATGETLQVVFFAIFTGVTLNKMGESGKRLIEIFHLLSQMVFKMIGMIMELSPYGAFALTALVIGTQGFDIVFSLGKLIIAVIIAMAFQYLIFGVLIKVFAKISPMPFYKKSLEYQALAFSTSSSKATLPTTMKVCEEKLGISKSSTAFILPLGASINMDGMAIYLGMCAVFFAQCTGVALSTSDYFMIVLTATLGSIGAAGIPSGSIVMLPLVLSSVGLPIEGVAIIAGIDRILDMMRTTINITGDATVTLIIDKSEGTLNEELYYAKTE